MVAKIGLMRNADRLVLAAATALLLLSGAAVARTRPYWQHPGRGDRRSGFAKNQQFRKRISNF